MRGFVFSEAELRAADNCAQALTRLIRAANQNHTPFADAQAEAKYQATFASLKLDTTRVRSAVDRDLRRAKLGGSDPDFQRRASWRDQLERVRERSAKC